ncbi:MAG: class I SAM-dependent methyltransferase [Pirellulales bacterium]|nr:class I SAM-dependent methyltransferase [Pirellulales bacterium]
MNSAQFQLHAQIEERHWWFVARRRILRDIVRQIAPSSGHREQIVVDIGCGTGANLAALAAEFRCVGVDTSAEAIELAKSRFCGITFLCGDAPSEVRPWLARADVVLLTDVLEHVLDDRGLLESIVDICAPGAKLVITVPAEMKLWSPHDTAFGHFRRYDAKTLARVWAGLPVKQRMLTHFNHRLYPAVKFARSLSRLRGRSFGSVDTDFRLPAQPVNRLLERIFAGESRHLLKALDADRPAYDRGVSLIAVLDCHNVVEPQLFDEPQPATPGIPAPTQPEMVEL